MGSLATYRAQDSTADGTPLASFSSIPATFLPQPFHLVSTGGMLNTSRSNLFFLLFSKQPANHKEKTDIDDQTITINGETKGAYSPEQVVALATEDVNKNLKNAESYTWFAVASYLEFYDWSRTLSGQYVATNNARRRNETSGDPYSLKGYRGSKELTFHGRRSDTREKRMRFNVQDAWWWSK